MNWDARKAWVRFAESLAVMALYFVAGVAGHAIPSTHGHASPLWPAAGIAFAAFLVRGRYLWVGVAAGSLLVNFFSHTSVWAAVGLTAGNTLGPAVGAALWARMPVTVIQRLGDVLRLICYGGLGSAISAVTGPVVLVVTGSRSWSGLPSAGLMWWLGDMLGVLLIVPLVLNFVDFKLSKRRLFELALLMACLVAGWELLFRSGAVTGAVFSFAILPFIIWGAVRFSIAGAALSSCMVSAVAVWETARGIGPFVGYATWLDRVEAVQMFIAVLSISGLCLAAVIAERDTVEGALAREEKLRRAQEQYRRIVETTNDGVWMIDAEYRTTFANRRLAEMLGFTSEEMLKRPLFDFLFPEDLPQRGADLERRRRGVREVLYRRYRKKDSSEMWALVSTNPVFAESGEFTGVLAMLSDVTLLRKTEEILRRNEKLITAARLAASISHEVNNPLEAAVNLLYLLKTQPLSEQSHQYVAMVEKEILRVSAISRRTLGFFRDTSARAEVSLPHLLDETLSFYEHQLAIHAVNVVRDYRTRGMVRVSQGEMQQVFANLISNALEAMENGGVLTLRVTESADHEPSGVRVDVEDTGKGITEADLKRIFEPFFTTKPNTGTGLGLWVTREIIEKHGGTIAVNSQSQPGGKHRTQFSIFLPHATTAAHAVA
jgi:PAS domain S-box-containing protein